MAEIDRLTVVFDANFKRLEDKLDKGLNKAVKASYGASAKIQKNLEGISLGRGIQGQLDGFAKSTAVGSTALSSFASAGLLATGIVGGLTIALQQVGAALQFADDLDASATKLGLTAEALQELTFAAADADVTAQSLEQGLAGLNNALGAYKAGVGDTKVKKVFEALGLSRKDLADVEDAADFIPILADKIKNLQSTAERVKIAKALGAEELVPLLEQGSDAIAEQTARARELGIVMSDELAAKAADANRELEIMGAVLKGNLNIQMANLGVWIVDVWQKLAPLIDRLDAFNKKYREYAALATGNWTSFETLRAARKAGESPRATADSMRATFAPRATAASMREVFGRRGSLGGDDDDEKKSKGSSRRATVDREAERIQRDIDQFYERLAAGNSESFKLFVEQFKKDIQDGPDNSITLVDGAGDAASSFKASVDEQSAYVQDSWANAIEGGIWAAMREGVPGIAEYFAQNLTQSLVESLSDNLASFLTSKGGSSGGGWVSALLSVFTGPRHATGTNYAPGGMSLVGENGPEIVNMPRGAQVIPSHAVRAMANMRAQGGGGAPVIQQFHLHAEGAVMTDQLMANLDAKAKGYAAKAVAVSVQTSRKGFAATSQRQSLLGST